MNRRQARPLTDEERAELGLDDEPEDPNCPCGGFASRGHRDDCPANPDHPDTPSLEDETPDELMALATEARPTTWGEALGIDEGPAFYETPIGDLIDGSEWS